MKKIPVFWFDKYVNIGDILGPWIVQKLVDDKKLKVEYSVNDTKLGALHIIIGALVRFRLPEWKYIKRLFVQGPILLSVGSILDQCHTDCIVWGAGFQNENESCENGKILAVRGFETIKRLKELNIAPPMSVNIAVGDPALLMPLLYKAKTAKCHKIGVVAHKADLDFVIDSFPGYHLLDVMTDNVTAFMDDICSCEYILTTSLHGLILSHTYGVPALWMRKNWIGSDGFKFRDYFSSVSMDYQDPLNADCVASMNQDEILALFKQKNCLPDPEVFAKLRQGLLESFPY